MELNTYQAFRPHMKSADLLEWRSKSFIGSCIRAKTGKDVNHSCLVLKLGFDGVCDRRFTLEALGGKFELCLLSRRLNDFKGMVYWHPLKEEYRNSADAVMSWALLQVGTRYDYPSLFASLFGHVSNDGKLLFCSESCFFAYEHAGLIKNCGITPWPGGFKKYGLHEDRVRVL